jgi:hypothetical protein
MTKPRVVEFDNMKDMRQLNDQDKINLSRHLDRLTSSYYRKGFGPYSIHMDLMHMILVWLVYNGVKVPMLHDVLDSVAGDVEQAKAQEESTQGTLQ